MVRGLSQTSGLVFNQWLLVIQTWLTVTYMFSNGFTHDKTVTKWTCNAHGIFDTWCARGRDGMAGEEQ